jgi:hypothetical protein
MTSRYRLTAPIRAILERPGGQRTSVTLPPVHCSINLPNHQGPFSEWLACTGKDGTPRSTRMSCSARVSGSQRPDGAQSSI